MNYSYFKELSSLELFKIFFFGLRFDLSVILLINLPTIFFSLLPFEFRGKKLYLIVIKTYFILINSLAIGVNLIDVIYFRFTLKRTTADILHYIGTGDDFSGLIPVFIRDFWYMFLMWFVLVFILIILTNRLQLQYNKTRKRKSKYYIRNSQIFLTAIFFTVIGIRGGFQLRPLSMMVAGKYTDAKNVPLVLNTPYTFLTTINKQALDYKSYFDEKTLNSIYSPYHKGDTKSTFKQKNIIIIIVESLSTEHVGALNKDIDNGLSQGFTPFLDSLIQHSLVFKAYANGKRSIEGIPAILSGIPTLMNDAFILSPYGGNNITSIANLLKEKSYHSAFFHGGNNGTMGFDNFSKMAGFQDYYGRNEYNNDRDFDGKWGIFDEEFLQYTANEMNSFSTPFIAAIMTLSSHHPYTIPEKYKGKFRKGKLEIQECIHYTDYSIEKFFNTISKFPWYKNTIFVITADHTSEAYIQKYKTNAGVFSIPIIFFDPDTNFNTISTKIAQQTDIMPSLLDYINFDNAFLAFGSSFFDNSEPRFAINYLNNNYQLFKDEYLYQFDGERSVALYDIQNDSLLKNNVIRYHPNKSKELENFTKAFIQQYNNRMIENRLTIK